MMKKMSIEEMKNVVGGCPVDEKVEKVKAIQSLVKIWTVDEFYNDEDITYDAYSYLPRFGECTIKDFPRYLTPINPRILNKVIGDIVYHQKPNDLCFVTICIDGLPKLYGRKEKNNFIPHVFNAEIIERLYIDKDQDGYRLNTVTIPEYDLELHVGTGYDYDGELARDYYHGKLKLNDDYPDSDEYRLLDVTVYRDYYNYYRYVAPDETAKVA